jgi:uncharacterized protein (TIGR00251 family)
LGSNKIPEPFWISIEYKSWHIENYKSSAHFKIFSHIMKRIEIKVIPNSNVDEVIEGEPLVVRVKAPPTKGKANKAVIALLYHYFNAPVTIVSGTKSRRKIVEVEER